MKGVTKEYLAMNIKMNTKVFKFLLDASFCSVDQSHEILCFLVYVSLFLLIYDIFLIITLLQVC